MDRLIFALVRTAYPDANSFDTDTVTITGSETASYTVSVPSQGENTFESFLLYVMTQDVGVQISNVAVTVASAAGLEQSTNLVSWGDSGDVLSDVILWIISVYCRGGAD